MIEVDRNRVSPKRKKKAVSKPKDRKKRGLIVTIILGSIAAHAVGLVLFGLFKIADYFKEPEATFVVEQKISVPAQTREHKMNMAKHMAMTPKPVFNEKLVSIRPTAFALPDLPKVPIAQMIPLDPSELISDQLASLSGSAGLGSGMGKGLAGGGGTGSGMSFFNIKDNARSIVIMIDVSASMFGRTGDVDYSQSKLVRKGKNQAFQVIREEAFKLVDSLSVNTLFGVIHWSGSARLWKDSLVPATKENRALAKEHIQTRVDYNKAGPLGGRPGGTRHDYALEALLALRPEVAFMLTDGNATRSLGRGKSETIEANALYQLIDNAAKDLPKIPRIHTIYYLTGKDKREEEQMLKGLSRKTKGKFSKQKAAKGNAR
jgi:hypothetical protein